jgi:hypothetical protein
MTVLYYPPQTGPVDDRIIGIGAHSEYVPFFLWSYIYLKKVVAM